MTTTAESDERFFDRAVLRIYRTTVVLGVIGTVAGWVAYGWTWGAGFLLGAAASLLNFHWLRRLVDALAASVLEGSGRSKPRAGLGLAVRYLILGTTAYAILKYSPLSLPAALTGLFAAVAAVIVEILFELVYARN